jgi:hypothetical protein
MFEKELYKKVFSIISSDTYNIFAEEIDLAEEDPWGCVSASLGGTTSADKDIVVSFVEDRDLFDRYNRGSFDVETSRYAQLLDTSRYHIADYHLTIPAGERNGTMKITLRPEGLSPDSTYLISLKVDEHTNYELNPDKCDILYRVYIKNFWASQKTITNYTLRGVHGPENESIYGVKRMHPLTRNSVRVVAGTLAFEEIASRIGTNCIILEIADDGHVSVQPYGSIQIEQIDDDPDYPNRFFIDDDGFRTFKSFLLHYKYRVKGTADFSDMREELRLEFNQE